MGATMVPIPDYNSSTYELDLDTQAALSSRIFESLGLRRPQELAVARSSDQSIWTKLSAYPLKGASSSDESITKSDGSREALYAPRVDQFKPERQLSSASTFFQSPLDNSSIGSPLSSRDYSPLITADDLFGNINDEFVAGSHQQGAPGLNDTVLMFANGPSDKAMASANPIEDLDWSSFPLFAPSSSSLSAVAPHFSQWTDWAQSTPQHINTSSQPEQWRGILDFAEYSFQPTNPVGSTSTSVAAATSSSASISAPLSTSNHYDDLSRQTSFASMQEIAPQQSAAATTTTSMPLTVFDLAQSQQTGQLDNMNSSGAEQQQQQQRIQIQGEQEQQQQCTPLTYPTYEALYKSLSVERDARRLSSTPLDQPASALPSPVQSHSHSRSTSTPTSSLSRRPSEVLLKRKRSSLANDVDFDVDDEEEQEDDDLFDDSFHTEKRTSSASTSTSTSTSSYPEAFLSTTGKRLFRCPSCSKTFDRYFNLKTHRLIHSSERQLNYQCPFVEDCGKLFARKADCCRHTKTVHLKRGEELKKGRGLAIVLS